MIKKLKKLPDSPGVYLFKRGREVLYVGKATSLRDRVRSYFSGKLVEARGPWLAKVLELADRVDFKKTDSVLEALLLEAELIHKYQPPHNAREKDNKSFAYLVITEEKWPRVLILRGRELETKYQGLKRRSMFGPFRSASELRIALKIVRKIFPFRDHTCSPESGKACFNFQIGLCPGVCVGKISRRDYLKLIRQLTLFFRGRKAQLVRSLEKEMKAAAKEQKFELASEIKRRLFALKHIQDVALIKKTAAKTGLRLEAYDIAHTSGKETVGAMVTSDNGELDKSGYRLFKLRGEFARQPHDIGNLVEVLQRRLNHSDWPVPAAIIVDGSKAQINAAKRVLKERDLNWPVVAVIKDEFHRARELIGDEIFIARHRQEILHLNAEAHRFALKFHRSRRKII